MRRAELVTALLMAALSIYLMVKSAELPIGWVPDEGPGGGSFPFWLSAAMLLSCLWILYNWYRRTSPPSQSDEPFMDSYASRSFVLAGGAHGGEGAVHVFAGELHERLAELPAGDAPMAVICGSGYRSTVAASVLERAGYENVMSVTGGMTAWRAAGLPMTRTEATVPQ